MFLTRSRRASMALYAFFALLTGTEAMAVTVTANPGACASVAAAGFTQGWARTNRAYTSNNSYATATVDGSKTRMLQCTGYGFAIPAGSTINGITVNVERKSGSAANGGSRDAAMRIIQGGTVGTADRSTSTIYTTADLLEAHGGAADLWGLGWTPAQINAANFGAAFAATKASAAGAAHTISVDYMSITVDYNPPTSGTYTVTAIPSSCASVAAAGFTRGWARTNRAYTSNNSYATATVDGTKTRLLQCTGYGFAIPAGATIDGITVNVERKSGSAANGGSRDAAMRIIQSGTVGTADRSTSTIYTTADLLEAHGGAADLWGLGWTPAQINAANFGAAFAATKASAAGAAHTISVDYMPISVTYTLGAAGPDHIRIMHDGNGLTCTPEVLTVIACANPACTAPHFTTVPVSGNVTWAGAPGGSVPFNISVAGTSTVNLPVTTVQTVSLGTSAVSPTPVSASDCVNTGGGAACSLPFADSGVILAMGNHVAETPQNISVSAVRKSTNSLSCVPAFSNVTRGVNLKCAYTNPVAGTLAVRIGGAALNVAGNPASACDGTGKTVSLAFDATGVANTTMQYADVGRVSLNATYTGSGATGDAGLVMTGTGSFVAAPASFAFSGVTSGLIRAGNPFNATITARNNANNATPNFGREIAAEGVTLTSNLIAPAGGINPVIGNNNVPGTSFSNGVATLSNLSWGEVGLITMTANLTSATYLNTGMTATGTSANIGAFTPDHFNTIIFAGMACPTGLTCPAQICPAGLTCPAPPSTPDGIAYSGQVFNAHIVAYNKSGIVTNNYDSAFGFSKAVTLSAMNAVGGAIANPGGGALTLNIVPATAFNLGIANSNTPVYTLPLLSVAPLTPAAPTDIFIRATDSDNISSLHLPASSIEGGIKIVNGRSKVSNAFGSELLPISMTATVQFWNGTGWVNSTTDGVTQFNTALNSAGGNLLPVIVSGPLTPGNISIASPSLVTVSLGTGTISFALNKPGVSGSVDMSLNAPLYLTTGSNTAGVNTSVPGRATFGVYSGNTDLIYQREAY